MHPQVTFDWHSYSFAYRPRDNTFEIGFDRMTMDIKDNNPSAQR